MYEFILEMNKTCPQHLQISAHLIEYAFFKCQSSTSNSKTIHYLSEVPVAVDVLLLVTILQLVVLDVEPESLHDAGPRLCVDTQQTSQAWVQFVLRWLEKRRQQKKKGKQGVRQLTAKC